MLESKVIQSDDTPVKQQADGKCKQCRFWRYVGDGIRGGPYVIYDYTPDRSRRSPRSTSTRNSKCKKRVNNLNLASARRILKENLCLVTTQSARMLNLDSDIRARPLGPNHHFAIFDPLCGYQATLIASSRHVVR